MGQKQKIGSNRTRHKNEIADRKVESNDSPDIPDQGRGETEMPGLPSGQLYGKNTFLQFKLTVSSFLYLKPCQNLTESIIMIERRVNQTVKL